MSKYNKNLNNSYYKTLDENFNQALSLFEQDLSKDELLNLLKDGNIVQKQIAALKLTEIESKEDAKILVSNLTGQDGKIREAVSLKIHELIKNPEFSLYFYDKSIYDTFLKSLTDVNANVCRNIIAAIKILKNSDDFCNYFTEHLIKMTIELIDNVKEFDFQDGKYKVNKQVFKLYWCLEAIYEFTDCIDTETIKSIVKQTKEINEYTIREKTAKILSKNFDDKELNEIRNILKKDKNYYVRRF